MKSKRLVVAASFVLLLASVPAAYAGSSDEPWSVAADFVGCLVQGVLNVL